MEEPSSEDSLDSDYSDESSEAEIEFNIESPTTSSSKPSDTPNAIADNNDEVPVYRTRTGRVIRKPSGIFALAFLTTSQIEGTSHDKVPDSISEAVSAERQSDWIDAARNELLAITKMGTFEVTKRPQGRNKIVRNKWVFALKKDNEGNIVRHKARLVAKGFTQIHGVDYSEVFAPVLRFDTVRFLLSVAASRDWELQQFDIETAFLNGDLEEQIYMEFPSMPNELKRSISAYLRKHPNHPNNEKLVEMMNKKNNHVLKLKKALYGLKQASREWFKKFRKLLKEAGLLECDSDPCLFQNEEKTLYVIVYVDDFLITAESKQLIDETARKLSTSMSIKNLGEPKVFIGVQIERDRVRKEIKISQRNYIESVIKKFNLENSSAEVPMNPSIELRKPTETRETTENGIPFRELIGCLMYISVQTRPDIAYAVSKLARYFTNYDGSHWNAAKQVAKYLNSTKNLVLAYGSQSKTDVQGYCDADWAGDKDSRKSTTGIVFTIGKTAFNWKSRLQSIVASSTMEAEYVAMALCTREALWVRKVQQDFGIPLPNNGIHISSDNVMALTLANENKQTAKSKHIDVCYHITQDYIQKKWIHLTYLSGNEIPADGLTKALNKIKFNMYVQRMGLKDSSN